MTISRFQTTIFLVQFFLNSQLIDTTIEKRMVLGFAFMSVKMGRGDLQVQIMNPIARKPLHSFNKIHHFGIVGKHFRF